VSVTVDTNVLVYAGNSDEPAQGQVRELLWRLARGPDLLYLFWPTIMGFLRIATHPGIFRDPLTPARASEAIAALVRRPNVRTPGEAQGYWGTFRMVAGNDTRGNDVADAHLAALMRQHGVSVIYTHDRDFRRYEGIEPRDPFT
jgi:toxin-antitoxin system PIN domain toxin